jgi:hypothetical protein
MVLITAAQQPRQPDLRAAPLPRKDFSAMASEMKSTSDWGSSDLTIPETLETARELLLLQGDLRNQAKFLIDQGVEWMFEDECALVEGEFPGLLQALRDYELDQIALYAVGQTREGRVGVVFHMGYGGFQIPDGIIELLGEQNIVVDLKFGVVDTGTYSLDLNSIRCDPNLVRLVLQHPDVADKLRVEWIEKDEAEFAMIKAYDGSESVYISQEAKKAKEVLEALEAAEKKAEAAEAKAEAAEAKAEAAEAKAEAAEAKVMAAEAKVMAIEEALKAANAKAEAKAKAVEETRSGPAAKAPTIVELVKFCYRVDHPQAANAARVLQVLLGEE